MRFLLFVAVLSFAPGAVHAQWNKVDQKTELMGLIDGKTLRRMGIRLQVFDNGKIEGRAFGRDVTGEWSWQGGYFCRNLVWGKRPIAYNCQWVGAKGKSKMRFQSDKGTGMFADFRVE